MQINITKRYHSTFIRVENINQYEKAKCWQPCGSIKTLYGMAMSINLVKPL